MQIEKAIEELLERLWTAREQGTATAVEAEDPEAQAALAEATRRTWVTWQEDRLGLTTAGDARAAGVIRRHRLAERLLCDVIQVDRDAMEAGACELEHSHVLSEEATDRICAFLGHPPTCPHDRPIPRGRCCERLSQDVKPLVTPLAEGTVGADYRIVFVASRSPRRLDRLCALAIAPGARLRLHQRAPVYVVGIGGTDVALAAEIAADIFVVPA